MSRDGAFQLSRPTSILLDGLRFTAALTVLIGHLTQPLFSTGWPDLTEAGIAAVGVFFVLSGFVIQYTRPRHADLADYARARLVRLWSVVIPALAFTAFADLISSSTNPAVYAAWAHSLPQNGAYLIADILFLNQSWGHELAFGSDNPIWSLGYEAAYYALFGASVYLRGWRRLLIIGLLVAVKGPQMLILFPVWLLGVATCDQLIRSRRPLLGVIVTLLGALAIYLSRRIHLEHALSWIPGGLGPHDNFTVLLGSGLVTASLIFLAELTRPAWGRLALAVESPVRWLAGSTFSIYLFHFPLLVMIQAVTRYPRGDALLKTAVFAVVLGCCIALSLVTERRKTWWNGPVRRLVGLFAAPPLPGRSEPTPARDTPV